MIGDGVPVPSVVGAEVGVVVGAVVGAVLLIGDAVAVGAVVGVAVVNGVGLADGDGALLASGRSRPDAVRPTMLRSVPLDVAHATGTVTGVVDTAGPHATTAVAMIATENPAASARFDKTFEETGLGFKECSGWAIWLLASSGAGLISASDKHTVNSYNSQGSGPHVCRKIP